MKRSMSFFLVFALVLPLGSAFAQEPDDKVARELRKELRERDRELARLRADLARDRGRLYGNLARAPRSDDRYSLTLLGRRPRVGITVRMEADDSVKQQGAEIDQVVPGSPAAEAGLEPGDIITHFGGEPLTATVPGDDNDSDDSPATRLIDRARELDEGEEAEVLYLRGGVAGKTTVTARTYNAPMLAFGTARKAYDRALRARDLNKDGQVDLFLPAIPDVGTRYVTRNAWPGLGVWAADQWSELELLAVGSELGEYFGTDRGLLVIGAGQDQSLGLEIGDVILEVGDREPKDAKHFLRILRNYDPGETVNLQVMRRQQQLTLSAEVPERPESRRNVGFLLPTLLQGNRAI